MLQSSSGPTFAGLLGHRCREWEGMGFYKRFGSRTDTRCAKWGPLCRNAAEFAMVAAS